jgi:hypothetical protein
MRLSGSTTSMKNGMERQRRATIGAIKASDPATAAAARRVVEPKCGQRLALFKVLLCRGPTPRFSEGFLVSAPLPASPAAFRALPFEVCRALPLIAHRLLRSEGRRRSPPPVQQALLCQYVNALLVGGIRYRVRRQKHCSNRDCQDKGHACQLA